MLMCVACAAILFTDSVPALHVLWTHISCMLNACDNVIPSRPSLHRSWLNHGDWLLMRPKGVFMCRFTHMWIGKALGQHETSKHMHVYSPFPQNQLNVLTPVFLHLKNRTVHRFHTVGFSDTWHKDKMTAYINIYNPCQSAVCQPSNSPLLGAAGFRINGNTWNQFQSMNGFSAGGFNNMWRLHKRRVNSL